jgi:hypothetical protein
MKEDSDMDVNDLLSKIQTIHLVLIETRQLLSENRNDMAFVKLVESQNKVELLVREVVDEIEKNEEPFDSEGVGPCSSCNGPEAHWCIDPYMQEIFNETYYMFLCYKCYQNRAEDI